MTSSEAEIKVAHGRLYWIFRNFLLWAKNLWQEHRGRFLLLLGVALFLALLARAWVQPLFLAVRIYSFEVIVAVTSIALIYHYHHRISRKKWLIILGVLVLMAVNYRYIGASPHKYLTLYWRYKTLDLRELEELPVTEHDRIQPLHSIRVQSLRGGMQDVHQVSEPYYVRVGDSYRFTMGIEPSYFFPRLIENVKGVLSLPGEAASPDFSSKNRTPVSFAVGENLLLGKNVKISTIRSFLNPFRFLSYSPSDVKYIKDDKGEWVEVVSLVRWKGILFPRPEFGGVQVIRQSEGGLLHWLKLMMIGDGEWIPPEEVANHSYLRGQPLIPYDVSRYAAESFRFQSGFFAPFPGSHQGDVRIPDLEGDYNEQPFTIYFRFLKEGGGENKLYHYFSLEPYTKANQGHNASVFYPADGIGPIFTYSHAKRNEALPGVSTIGASVMGSRAFNDWDQNYPAEHRPFIKLIDGVVRFMWLTTIVTYTDKTRSDFVAGSNPEVTITDAATKKVVWINTNLPRKEWFNNLKQELASAIDEGG